MKNINLIIISLFTTIQVFSQSPSHVEFAYDDAGNRTTRQVIYLKSTEVDTMQQLKETALPQVADSVEYTSNIGSREVSIFPNPTRGLLTIAMEITNDDSPVKLELFSLAGESILQQQIRSSKTSVDLSAQPPGTYLLKISSATGGQTWKVVKE
jgi:hypothetical protein